MQYFVDSSAGDDTHSGVSNTTPWKTIAKVNSTTLHAGDSVLLKCGSSWFETLSISQNGTLSSPITFSSYGSGALPNLTGFLTTSGWINQGGGIWSFTDGTLGANVNSLTIDGANQGLGRFPRTGYNTYGSFSGLTSITDIGLANSPSFIGGEVVIRKNHFILTRGTITGQTGGTITYTTPLTSANNPTANYGYFVQNHINCLTQFGDWCYSASTNTISMYFGSDLPTNHVINVSALNNLVNFTSNKNYNRFVGINFTGANQYSVNSVYGGIDNQFVSCSSSFTGIRDFWLAGANNNTVDNCLFTDSQNNAVTLSDATGNNRVVNNYLNRIGAIAGMGQSDTVTNSFGNYCGIELGFAFTANNNVIQNNVVLNCGSNAIASAGDNLLIDSNYVDTCCSVLDDGGGIYIGGQQGTPRVYTSRTVSNNIVFNSLGAPLGTTGTNQGNGIYLDDNSSQVTVIQNTVANCGQHGYFFHNNHNINCLNNMGYNNTVSQYSFVHDNVQTAAVMANLLFNANTAISSNSGQMCVLFQSIASNSSPSDVSALTANNNYYGSVVSNTFLLKTQFTGFSAVINDLNGWKALFTGQEINSSVTDFSTFASYRFDYNATQSNQAINLVDNFQDIRLNQYTGNITLAPFASNFLVYVSAANPIININYMTKITNIPAKTNGDLLQATEINTIISTINDNATIGIINGGTTGQSLKKRSSTDFDTAWIDDILPIRAQATLTFGATAAGTSSEQTISVAGAIDGDVVQVGVPNASVNANSDFTARVSSTSIVSVRFNNYSSGSITPAAGVFKVVVFH